ncbi:p300 cbp acetyl-transferase [Plasmopara halstedii]|uniref:histone acetyltransferase n=1 Tax=Plasmopara halstedii TaxID=4781 RepID=A0A0P1AY80_PLAHL|nr:p300 cbp acetyl-transferase [Plasmopara halstedii]CEG47398.1 p300 cbp acetyl-transferase [Plasmopara halstedii]|eukprot:XP_024583767.1 p300 cbp acetyl-transferase [Plasmopara halstedii]
MDVTMEDHGSASHEEKFRTYNEALVHAATCSATKCDALDGRCHKVKASIDHFVRCYGPRRKISPIESCEMCSKIWGLLCFHAKTCRMPLDQRCTVSQCDYLRDKIARKRENDRRELQEAKVKIQIQLKEWPVERRVAQVEADRQQVLQLIADIRAGKTRQPQVIQAQQQPMMSTS